MKKALTLAVCLLLAIVVVAGVTGCGAKEEQEKESETEETETGGKVKVPDVTGLSLDDARESLEASDLDCGVNEVKVTDVDKEGKVLSQDPEPGTMLTPDMTVYLEVGDF